MKTILKRAWIHYNNTWVKVDFSKISQIREGYGGSTDEGYYNTATAWKLEDDLLEQHYCEWGSDCDGYHERGGVLVWDGKKTDNCWGERMADFYIPQNCKSAAAKAHREKRRQEFIKMHSDVKFPDWEEHDRYLRDQFAEEMGY